MKKAIKESKVKRMRNLATGNYNSSTEIQTGYNKRRVKRVEGDIWEERGKTWTIKGGLRQNITKMDEARETLRMPLCCPKCDNRMNHRFDKGCWDLMKHCFNCHVKWDTKMRIKGVYKDFLTREHGKNFDAWIENIELEYNQWLDSREGKQYVTEAGTFEKWKGGQGRKELELIFNNRINELKTGVKNG
jgi:ribosomal protein L37AE/L43A